MQHLHYNLVFPYLEVDDNYYNNYIENDDDDRF